MKEILEHFRVWIDENGKEVENGYVIRALNGGGMITSPKTTEVIKLPTLSEFVKDEQNHPDWSPIGFFENVTDYNDFLQQPLSKEMFIGEDAIFKHQYNVQGSRGSYHFDNRLIYVKEVYYEFGENDKAYFLFDGRKITTIEQALNAGGILYLNPEKI